MTDTWNPTQYDRFRAEREQPLVDLLSMIRPAPAMRIVDLGCGTGRLTRRLHAELAARETTGIDRSERMLERAREEGDAPGLRFEAGAIEAFCADAAFDLVFSNAAFHWVEDHPALIGRLHASLAPGGQLVFQIPASHEAASHRVAEEVADLEPFSSALNGWRRPQPVLTPVEYASLLFRNGFAEQQTRLIVYPHVLGSRDEVVEWMKGTLLTEYERHLPPELFPAFLETYRERLLPKLEDVRPFFFPFPRILCRGCKNR
jgi:trans-aconitate 2-methyltransferase